MLEETLEANIGDASLNKRLGHLLEVFSSCLDKQIPGACGGWKETVAAYRFFDNEQVTPEKILSPHKIYLEQELKENLLNHFDETSSAVKKMN